MKEYKIQYNGTMVQEKCKFDDVVAITGVHSNAIKYHINTGKTDFKINGYDVQVLKDTKKKSKKTDPKIKPIATKYTIVGKTGKVYANLTRVAACKKLRCGGALLTKHKKNNTLPFKHKSYTVYDANEYIIPEIEESIEKPTEDFDVSDYCYTTYNHNSGELSFTQSIGLVSKKANLNKGGVELLISDFKLPLTINDITIYDAKTVNADDTFIDNIRGMTEKYNNIDLTNLFIVAKDNGFEIIEKGNLGEHVVENAVYNLAKRYGYPVEIDNVIVSSFSKYAMLYDFINDEMVN